MKHFNFLFVLQLDDELLYEMIVELLKFYRDRYSHIKLFEESKLIYSIHHFNPYNLNGDLAEEQLDWWFFDKINELKDLVDKIDLSDYHKFSIHLC